ncbi:YugN family protein [Neobacillus kokaensis]|uniref:YugN-like family protein n=1 Tax=Neobacillus kokaensis TaxID=2759023 RepID=A0ABQ3NBJ6_9BACI|nr:YugN family protein [Neobacillus kokaensis]GHI01281.1 hypothetical protein AM1BK_48230 [Neobacillus kokaensis]
MNFENTGIEKFKADINRLDEIMEEHGLVRAGQWDYERVTYDRKFELREGTFYLRLQGYALDGDVDTFTATIQLMTPALGKHYYPHGVEYGADEKFPASLVTQCKKIIEEVKAEVEKIAI